MCPAPPKPGCLPRVFQFYGRKTSTIMKIQISSIQFEHQNLKVKTLPGRGR